MNMLPGTSSSPHIHSGNAVGRIMRQVMLALLPAIVVYVALFGWGIVLTLLLAMLTALGCEALMLRLRQRPLAPFLGDGSALLTAMLLALALPPLAPWWLIVTGTAFAIIIAKHLYGGLGYNPFNPAMVGYVVLLISFPREVTDWLPPASLSGHHTGLGEALQAIFAGATATAPDSVSMATPLDMLKTQLGQGHATGEILASPVYGVFAGTGWEWIALAYLAGGLWLLYVRAIRWHIPAAMLASLAIVSGFFYLIDPQHYASPLFHLLGGAAMLGAFFIATDPITASTTDRGRLLYGAGIGLLVYVIRAWGGYPDGVAFAVLLMNIMAPTLDQFTRPRVFGRGRS